MNPEDDRAASPAADAAVESEESTRTPEEIEAEIEATREELGETASALAEKADVKGQAQRKVEQDEAQGPGSLSGASDTAKELAVNAPAGARESWEARDLPRAQSGWRHRPAQAPALGTMRQGPHAGEHRQRPARRG